MAETFDWCSFFALFWNDKGIKCKVNIPDTVLFRYGQVSAWWFTNKEGYLQRHASHAVTLEGIRKRFLQVSSDDDANYSKFVALVRAGDGRPQLLRSQAFNQICELLSDRLEAGHPQAVPEVETPSVMQSFSQPFADMRYITTYINNGVQVTCHTFQRKYSRRYTADVQPADSSSMHSGALALISAGLDAGSGDEASTQPVDPALKMQFRKLATHIVQYIEKAHGLTLAGIVCEWVRDSAGKVYLLSVLRTEWASNAAGHGAGSLASAVHSAEPLEEPDIMPQEPVLANLQAAAAGADAYRRGPKRRSSSDYGADSVVWDGADSATFTLRPTSAMPFNAGGGPSSCHAAGALSAPGTAPGSPTLRTIEEEASRASTYGSRRGSLVVSPPPATMAASTTEFDTELDRAIAGVVKPAGTPGVGSGTTRNHLAAYPGGHRSAGLSVSVSNTWPSHQHDAQLSPSAQTLAGSYVQITAHQTSKVRSSSAGPLFPTSHSYGQSGFGEELPSPSGRPPSAYPGRNMGTSSGTHGRIMSAQQASRSQPISAQQAAAERNRLPRPGTAPIAFGRTVPSTPPRGMSATTSPGMMPSSNARDVSPSGSRLGSARPVNSCNTGHVNSGPRGAPLMMQQVTKEVEALRDQLLFQNQMAEANASKVRQLEKEKELMVQAYEQKVTELDSALRQARQELRGAGSERSHSHTRAVAAEGRVDELEEQVRRLQGIIDSERGTVIATLKECQARDSAVTEKEVQLEAEVLRLTERLKEETATVNALKRQLLQFSDIAEKYKTILKEGEYEPGMQQVIDKVHNLFATQTNPLGEQYAVQKVLSQYNPQLRAVFLYYAQLDDTFTQHWPPSLAFQQFMLFCKDTETSDPRATSRVNPNLLPLKMLHPRECETVFRVYAELDMTAAQSTGPVLTYEAFLSALVDLSNRVRRDTPYLSEGIRNYITYYMCKAQRVQAAGQMSKGRMRSAVEGTAVAKEYINAGRDSSSAKAKRKGGSGKKAGEGGGGHNGSRPESAISLMSLSGKVYSPPPNLRL